MIPLQTHDEVLQMYACEAMPGDLVVLMADSKNQHDFHVSVWAHLEDGDYTSIAVLTSADTFAKIPATKDLLDLQTGVKSPVKILGTSLALATSGPVQVGVAVIKKQDLP